MEVPGEAGAGSGAAALAAPCSGRPARLLIVPREAHFASSSALILHGFGWG